MSDRESSDAERAAYGGIEYTRWPGLLSLSLGWLLPPAITLLTQTLIYSANMWACGRKLQGTMHIIPALALVITIGTGVAAYINWKRTGRGVELEYGAVLTRSRFIALGGIFISIFSSLVVLAMWATIFIFDPCMRI